MENNGQATMEKKKGGLRVSWVDGLLVLLVLGMIAAAVIKFGFSDEINARTQVVPLTYEVTIQGILPTTADQIDMGSTLLFYSDTAEDQVLAGVLANKEISPYYLNMPMDDGTVALLPQEGRIDLVMTVEADLFRTEDGYFFDADKELFIGAYLYIHSQKVLCPGTVTAIYES